MLKQETAKPPLSVEEYGFKRCETGPDFLPADADLMPCFQGKVDSALPTVLLTTDQGNQVMFTSLIRAHKGLEKIASEIEEKGQHRYSNQIQGDALGVLKIIADEGGRGNRTVTGSKQTIYYGGNTSVSNGRLVRVYLTKVGDVGDVPVYAKIAACRTKNHEADVYKLLGIANKFKT